MSFLVRNWCGARLVVAGNDRIVAFDVEAIAKERFGDTTCVNMLLIGYASQQGLIPVSERDRSLLEQSEHAAKSLWKRGANSGKTADEIFVSSSCVS